MANLITITGPFDGMKMNSTMTFNGDLVSGLFWTPEKSGITTMEFTNGNTWNFYGAETKSSTVLNYLASIIASPSVNKKVTFPPSVDIKRIDTFSAETKAAVEMAVEVV